jgi:hypothetical protein
MVGALERSTVGRRPVRREHGRDRQCEQRPQSFDGLLAGHAVLAHEVMLARADGVRKSCLRIRIGV